MEIVFLGIGTNLGERESNLKVAVAMIANNIGIVVKTSSVYETEPWGFQTNDQFLNMVVMVETKLNPSGVLGAILMIEAHLGRIRTEKQYESRIIDIDILLYSDKVLDEVSLKIPHPELPHRKFVLIPLCEIAPELVHPVINKTIISLLAECKDKSLVRQYFFSLKPPFLIPPKGENNLLVN
jgi:2-amino-4-hydroxy-6-hydroxymethyldihydropteridine diphosphokinase